MNHLWVGNNDSKSTKSIVEKFLIHILQKMQIFNSYFIKGVRELRKLCQTHQRKSALNVYQTVCWSLKQGHLTPLIKKSGKKKKKKRKSYRIKISNKKISSNIHALLILRCLYNKKHMSTELPT